MTTRFRHVALVGKHQAQGMRGVLEQIAAFLRQQGLQVSLEAQTALNTGMTEFGALNADELGRQCDLAVVVGATARCWALRGNWRATARRWWASTKGGWGS
jgi:NAD+ kinase